MEQTYYQRNRDLCLERAKNYQREHKDTYKQYQSAYFQKKKALRPPKPPRPPREKKEKIKKPKEIPEIKMETILSSLESIEQSSILVVEQRETDYIVSFD